MLALVADLYTPLLAITCVFYLKSRINKQFVIALFVSYLYVYAFAFIEFYFGWWRMMNGDFSSHTAAVMVMVFAMLSANYKIGITALISMLGYGILMNLLNYHSWFDIVTTMLVCLPCWVFFILAKPSSLNLARN